MKKREVYEGIIQKVTFPNKGLVNVEGEEKSVICLLYTSGGFRKAEDRKGI